MTTAHPKVGCAVARPYPIEKVRCLVAELAVLAEESDPERIHFLPEDQRHEQEESALANNKNLQDSGFGYGVSPSVDSCGASAWGGGRGATGGGACAPGTTPPARTPSSPAGP